MNSERGQPIFPYHYGFEAESYTFYRVPKVLFTEPEFKVLSTDARLLYGLLLDRMQLSVRNGWMDEEGRVYIFFTVESIMEALACGNKKAGQLLAELDDRKGIGLISRVRQGQGKPDRIYVHKCITQDMSKRHFKTCQKDIPGDVENTCQDMSKRHPNKTDIRNTENNETDLIESYHPDYPEKESVTGESREQHPGSDGMDRAGYIQYFEDSLSLDVLRQDFPYRKDQINEIAALMADVCAAGKPCIRISGDDIPTGEVRERFLSMNCEHIRYVIESMNGTTGRVHNIRQYLLTALYNAPLTISNYYDALVRHDMYGNGGR